MNKNDDVYMLIDDTDHIGVKEEVEIRKLIESNPELKAKIELVDKKLDEEEKMNNQE